MKSRTITIRSGGRNGPGTQRPSVTGILLLSAAMAFLPVWLAAQTNQENDKTSGKVIGTVFTRDADGSRSVVPGALVKLTGPSGSQQTATDEQGRYSFSGVTANTYRVEVTAPELSGSDTVTLFPGATLNAPIEMKVEAVQQSVTVTDSADSVVPKEASDETAVNKSTLVNAPIKQDHVESLLPLIPGVVRGPDGLINMKGARASQGGALVNSASVTDPATGTSAMSLPIDIVQSVKVIANPYDPEYGRLTGAVSSVETVTGNVNGFHASAQNLMVRPRKRDGSFIGIESATPRFSITGPLVRNKVAFTQSLEYRYIRTPVESLPALQRDMKLEGFTSFSQIDATLNQRQSLTASLVVYPQKFNYLGLNTFNPQPSTPDLHQRGFMGSLQHRYVMGEDSLLVTQFNHKRFDVDVTANSTDPYQLFVETTRGGFFGQQQRETSRTGWQETYQYTRRNFLGIHQFKIGMDYAHSDYDGRVALQPFSVIGVANLPLERVTFGAAGRFDIKQDEFAWFLADKWSPSQRLTLELGLRVDRDSGTDSTALAPRAGFALKLTQDAKTVLRGGAGVFYDRVPLNIMSFPYLPDRTVDRLTSTGKVFSRVAYQNAITAELRNPRSVGLNVDLDRQVTSTLLVRIGFQQRNTSRDFSLTPEESQGILSLSNAGRAHYREFRVAAEYKIRRGTLNASYVRSRAFGNLNDFNQFFGNNAVAVIQPDARGRQPFDAPNRFLAWGQWEAPFKLTVLPVLDVHTGFPHSVTNQEREFVGRRNAERFPRFSSFDLQVTRPIVIHLAHERLKARIGFSVFNLFNHFNPRDIQTDIDSYRYGGLFNGVGRTFRGKFILEF